MAVTASVGGESGDDTWTIEYDDVTRAVTTVATGTGFVYASVQVTATITRTIAYTPSPGAVSSKQWLADLMAAADFHVVTDGTRQTLATGINPNQVVKAVGKTGSGGFSGSASWSQT